MILSPLYSLKNNKTNEKNGNEKMKGILPIENNSIRPTYLLTFYLNRQFHVL